MFGCCCWFGYSELSEERCEDGDYAIILDGREEFFIREVMAQREITLLDIGTGNRERWKRGRRTRKFLWTFPGWGAMSYKMCIGPVS